MKFMNFLLNSEFEKVSKLKVKESINFFGITIERTKNGFWLKEQDK